MGEFVDWISLFFARMAENKILPYPPAFEQKSFPRRLINCNWPVAKLLGKSF